MDRGREQGIKIVILMKRKCWFFLPETRTIWIGTGFLCLEFLFFLELIVQKSTSLFFHSVCVRSGQVKAALQFYVSRYLSQRWTFSNSMLTLGALKDTLCFFSFSFLKCVIKVFCVYKMLGK